MLVVNIYLVYLLFLILCNGYDRFLIVGHREIFTFGCVFWHLDRTKYFLDFGFNLVYVDITHYNYTLQIWTIPFFVVVAQILIREIVYNIH